MKLNMFYLKFLNRLARLLMILYICPFAFQFCTYMEDAEVTLYMENQRTLKLYIYIYICMWLISNDDIWFINGPSTGPLGYRWSICYRRLAVHAAGACSGSRLREIVLLRSRGGLPCLALEKPSPSFTTLVYPLRYMRMWAVYIPYSLYTFKPYLRLGL